MPTQPIMKASSSEADYLLNRLEDIIDIDTTMIYPDWKIFSKVGYTVGISRASVKDLLFNKLDVHSHVVEELVNMDTDLKIFLLEGFMGCDNNGDVVFPGGIRTNTKYIYAMNNIVSACISQGALLIPSATIACTALMLREWNNTYFQKTKHESLEIRPRKAGNIQKGKDEETEQLISSSYSLDLSTDAQEWWLSDIPELSIGRRRVKEALKVHGTLFNLFIQPVFELEKIPMWGKTIAKDFRNFLDKQVEIK